MPLPTRVTVPNLVVEKVKPYGRNYEDLPENSDPHAPPFKINQFEQNTDRSAADYFLLASRSNYSPISYRF